MIATDNSNGSSFVGKRQTLKLTAPSFWSQEHPQGSKRKVGGGRQAKGHSYLQPDISTFVQ